MDLAQLMNQLTTNDDKNIFKTITAKINQVETDLVWGQFGNSILLIVTQFGRIGSLVVAEKENSLIDTSKEISYDIKHLLGTGDIQNEVTARFLAEKLNIEKSLYIFSSLKDHSPETLKAISDICIETFIK